MMRTPTKQTKNLLILDPFWTLAYWWDEPLDRAADCCVGEYFVYKRPYLSQFLAACSEWYDIGVWTTDEVGHVDLIVNEIFPEPARLQFVWGDRNSFRDIAHNFDGLAGLGWTPERILIVQSPAIKGPEDTLNTVCPKIFEGDEDDDELMHLASYLHEVKNCENYRKINKRNWRKRTRPDYP